jgi:hypothetical protein
MTELLGFIPQNAKGIKAMLGSSVHIYSVARGKHTSVYQSFGYSESTYSLARPPRTKDLCSDVLQQTCPHFILHLMPAMHTKIASIAQLGERQTEEIHSSIWRPSVRFTVEARIPFELIASLVPQTPPNSNPTYCSIRGLLPTVYPT